MRIDPCKGCGEYIDIASDHSPDCPTRRTVEYAPGEPGERQTPHPRTSETATLIAQLRAALRLIDNEHITPVGRRMLEKVLDAHEGDR